MISPDAFIANLLPKLRSESITYFPVRHHSPACAAHLQRWIETHRPASILIEGPESFSALIPHLVDERTVCPIAIYTNFVDKKNRLLPDKADIDPEVLKLMGTPRFAAYYPFCDYSPELVSLREGNTHNAKLRFIDLEYAEMVLHSHQLSDEKKESLKVISLTEDRHLRHSEYVQALTQRLGCRDFNELWDHLFESGWDDLDTDEFLNRVATWCAMVRLDYTEEDLHQDGTHAREACMASAICEELAHNRGGPILVVTGGFHTVALPDLVAKNVKRPKRPAFTEEELGTWLMRYSFDQLDSLAGYASGMPGPAFYDQMWQATKHSEGMTGNQAREYAAVDLIVDIGRLTREHDMPTMISTPDAIAAVEMMKQLTHLREHPWPMREDVLDGMRSCFVKGEIQVEGRLLMRLVREILAGQRIGQVPPGVGTPPIVDDFNQEARRLRIPTDSTQPKESVLDLYRKSNHREISRLLHRLEMLGVPYGMFQGGPDFVTGTGLELMQEHWQLAWSPGTDSALIEASIYGATVAEAAGEKLTEMIGHLEDEAQGRNTFAAVTMLIRACRMGLHQHTATLIPLIDAHIAEDPELPSVVKGLSQLELLAHSREPLEATQLTAVPQLMIAAYQRACRLLHDAVHCPDEMVNEMLNAIRSLREIVADERTSDKEQPLDQELFMTALERIVNSPPQQAQSAIVGAAAGVLYGEGRIDEVELITIVRGFLTGTSTDARRTCGVLRGLLATAREVAWQVTELLEALDTQFGQWDEEMFLQSLPDLRLAFADLTPREITKVADHVAGLHDETSMGELVHTDLDETEVQLGLQITQRVRKILKDDGF